jgi:DNA-binding GntR family transcriptional regulator
MSITFRSKKEIVYEELRKAIIRGDYSPGSRLVIDQLAVELGVSQIPIREAIHQLEADGLVTIEPYTGATVTELSADFIFEVFALLESMEIISSRQACQSMTDEQLETMARHIKQMDASVGVPEQWAQENKELHLYICAWTGMALVKNIMQKVLAHWDRLRLHYLKDVSGARIEEAQREHWQILEAFRSRDPDEVERVIRAHNQSARMSYVQHLQAGGHLRTTKTNPK